MNVSDVKKARALATVTRIRADCGRMPGLFLTKVGRVQPRDIERIFYEYATRDPEVATLFSFAVPARMRSALW